MSKNLLISKAYKIGYEYQKKHHGCSQTTVGAIQDVLEVRNDFVFKAASGLSGGCGLMRDGICGGYSGAILVMSSFFGRERKKIDNDRDHNYLSYYMAKKLRKKFLNHYGSIICKDIHNKVFGRSYDFWNPEEKILMEKSGAHDTISPSIIGNATSWAVEIILEEIKSRNIDINIFTKNMQYY